MKLFSLLVVSVSFLGLSCERHDFDGPEGTRQLHEHHGSNAEHDEHAEKNAH